MEHFPDGTHVRLRSCVHGTYLHADEDGVGVSLRPERASMNAVWKVHRIVRDGVPFVLLYGAAYGRYLTATNDRTPFGYVGHRVVQGVYDEEEQTSVVWIPGEVAGGNNKVILKHRTGSRLLRANGRYRKRNTGVTVDAYNNRTTMMHWVVEAVPLLASPPAFAPPPTPLPVPPKKGLASLLQKRRPATLRREVRFVRADDNGNINDQGWATFTFYGHHAYILRDHVATKIGYRFFFYRVTVCNRPGRYGRLTPLIGELPRNQEPMDIIALIHKTPAEDALQYPDLAAP